jgi:hypothetical protein
MITKKEQHWHKNRHRSMEHRRSKNKPVQLQPPVVAKHTLEERQPLPQTVWGKWDIHM